MLGWAIPPPRSWQDLRHLRGGHGEEQRRQVHAQGRQGGPRPAHRVLQLQGVARATHSSLERNPSPVLPERTALTLRRRVSCGPVARVCSAARARPKLNICIKASFHPGRSNFIRLLLQSRVTVTSRANRIRGLSMAGAHIPRHAR